MKYSIVSSLMFAGLSAAACGGSGGSGGTGGSAVTWVDPATNLEWQIEATPGIDWADAKATCSGLTLGGPGAWRLPTVDEARTLVVGCAATETGGTCGVVSQPPCLDSETCRDGSCGGCTQAELPPQGCFWPATLEGDCGFYWTVDVDSNAAMMGANAWGVGYNGAHVSTLLKTDVGAARCVR